MVKEVVGFGLLIIILPMHTLGIILFTEDLVLGYGLVLLKKIIFIIIRLSALADMEFGR